MGNRLKIRMNSLSSWVETRADLFRIYEMVFPAMRVGATPSEVADEDGESGFRLIHYKCGCDQTERNSILFIPHIINHPYILDLYEDVSVVQTFCKHGFNVCLVDWGYPRRRNTGFADYAGYVDGCVRLLVGGKKVSIMGYCTGGIVSLIYMPACMRTVYVCSWLEARSSPARRRPAKVWPLE